MPISLCIPYHTLILVPETSPLVTCLQSCPELRVEVVDYLQQDLSGFASGQAAETLALVVDVTADESSMPAMQKLLQEVCRVCHF